MFDEAPGGLPLHPLVIHIVVLSIPLTFVLALTFAMPRFRPLARWPLAVVAVGSFAATFVAVESGEALATVLRIFEQDTAARPLIERHYDLGRQLRWMTLATAVLGVLVALLVGRRPPGGDRTPARRGLEVGLVVALLVVAAVASFWAYRVGDLGARAVWNPTGAQNYQVGG